MKRLLFILLINLISILLFAQRQEMDSLLLLLNADNQDTVKVHHLNDLAYLFRNSKPDSTIILCEQSILICKKHPELKVWMGYSNAIGNMAIGYRLSGNFLKAKEFYFEALKMDEVLGNKFGIGKRLVGIANVFDNMANYPKALDYAFKALKINEEIKNQRAIALCYGVIGNIYINQKEYDKALIYQLKGLKTFESINDKNNIVSTYGKIAIIYSEQKKYAPALKFLNKAIQIAENAKLEQLEAEIMNSIGFVYLDQKEYQQALTYYFKGLEKDKLLNINTGMSNEYNYIGYIYMTQNNFDLAEKYLLQGLDAGKHIGALNNQLQIENNLAELYKRWNKPILAFEHLKTAMFLKDSIFNQRNTQMIMNMEFDIKEAGTKVEQEKKDLRQRNIRNSIIVGLLGALVFLVILYRQRNKINREKKRSDELLLNILPLEVADELKLNGSALAKQYNHVTVLFTDFVNFTGISEQLSPTELVAEIHKYFTAFDAIIEKHGLEKIKTIGDAYMAVCGLPHETEDHAIRVVMAAIEIRDYVEKSNGKFKIRIGLNSGPVVAGIVGVKKYAYDIWGDTVNTASRMESNSEAGKINVSESTYEFVKEKFICKYRGKISVKGKGEIDMYFVENKNDNLENNNQ